MDVKTRQAIETRIATEFVTEALKAGFAISLSDCDDESIMTVDKSTDKAVILAAMFGTDDERLYLTQNGKRCGWCWFVYGNDGWDVICDYTTNLEPIMPNVEALADKICEQING